MHHEFRPSRPGRRQHLARPVLRRAPHRQRRGLFQHLDDRLPGNPDRPLLSRADRRDDLSAHRQHRHQRARCRVGRSPTSPASSCASFRPSSAAGAARRSLASYLERYKIPGITGIDTRSLTLRLRTQGSLRGVLTSEKISDAAAVDLAKKWTYLERDFVKEVTMRQGLRLGPQGQAQPQVDAHPGQARARRACPSPARIISRRCRR